MNGVIIAQRSGCGWTGPTVLVGDKQCRSFWPDQTRPREKRPELASSIGQYQKNNNQTGLANEKEWAQMYCTLQTAGAV